MIRSIYETVTDSCVPFLLDDKPISQRIPAYASLRRRGLLAYEPAAPGSSQREWVLYSTAAKTAEVSVSGGNIQFMDGRRLKEKNGDFVPGKGWLQYNIPVKKDNYHIAYLNPKEVVYRWKSTEDDDPYQQLKTALNGPAQKLKSRNQVPNKNIAEALKRAKMERVIWFRYIILLYIGTISLWSIYQTHRSGGSLRGVNGKRLWESMRHAKTRIVCARHA